MHNSTNRNTGTVTSNMRAIHSSTTQAMGVRRDDGGGKQLDLKKQRARLSAHYNGPEDWHFQILVQFPQSVKAWWSNAHASAAKDWLITSRVISAILSGRQPLESVDDTIAYLEGARLIRKRPQGRDKGFKVEAMETALAGLRVAPMSTIEGAQDYSVLRAYEKQPLAADPAWLLGVKAAYRTLVRAKGEEPTALFDTPDFYRGEDNAITTMPMEFVVQLAMSAHEALKTLSSTPWLNGPSPARLLDVSVPSRVEDDLLSDSSGSAKVNQSGLTGYVEAHGPVFKVTVSASGGGTVKFTQCLPDVPCIGQRAELTAGDKLVQTACKAFVLSHLTPRLKKFIGHPVITQNYEGAFGDWLSLPVATEPDHPSAKGALFGNTLLRSNKGNQSLMFEIKQTGDLALAWRDIREAEKAALPETAETATMEMEVVEPQPESVVEPQPESVVDITTGDDPVEAEITEEAPAASAPAPKRRKKSAAPAAAV